jgi:hypothetical protein
MKFMNRWMLIILILATSAIVLAVVPLDSTNQPPPDPGPDQSIPLGGTNQTSRTTTNATLPPMYQGTISNLHDRVGTNAVNQGNDNPEPRPPHVPPQ